MYDLLKLNYKLVDCFRVFVRKLSFLISYFKILNLTNLNLIILNLNHHDFLSIDFLITLTLGNFLCSIWFRLDRYFFKQLVI